MKFYELDTPDGPVLEVRQDVAKKSKHPFKVVDIPTDQKGLMTLLNELRRKPDGIIVPVTAMTSEIIPAGADNPVEIKLPKLAPGRVPPYQASKMFEHDDIVVLISEARGFQLANYFGAVLEAAERAKKELST